MKNDYDHDYFKNRHRKTVHSAQKILSIVIDAMPELQSAVDFGCGVGTWLSVLSEKGVKEILGLDGPWVDQEFLEIPRQCFSRVNFEEGIHLDKKYGLALTLEVAEHMTEAAASGFVESLANASNYILFSAAIPYQGGTNHFNEQWPDYWADLFRKRGYVALDFVRKTIWNDKQIGLAYRQNILMFVKKEEIQRVKILQSVEFENHSPLSIVHPEHYLRMVNRETSVRGSLKRFRRAVKKWFKKMMHQSR